MTITNQPSPLVAEKLSHYFGKKRALNSINIAIPSTGITALLGANGAGKTTLINCALGLLKPSSGDLRVLQGKAGTQAIKQQIGVMLQDADLPDLLTAREHITLFSTYYSNPINIDELIKQCDLIEFADTRYRKLSGGQKRRVQFALAILGRPKLVFLDEPTTGLDIDARRVLWNTIRELSSTGTTIVLTTHYLEEADALADRIMVIDRGQLIADGSANEIRKVVSGAVIRCESNLSISTAEQLSGVRSANRSGRYLEVVTNNGTETLKELLSKDPKLSDLTVQKPTLENAFTQLINTPKKQSTRSNQGELA